MYTSIQVTLFHATSFLLALAVAQLLFASIRLDRGGCMIAIITLASYALFCLTLSGLFGSVGGQ